MSEDIMLWSRDVNSYSVWLRISESASSIKTIEACANRLNEIRNKWPSQSKIFDQMDRENVA